MDRWVALSALEADDPRRRAAFGDGGSSAAKGSQRTQAEVSLAEHDTFLAMEKRLTSCWVDTAGFSATVVSICWANTG